MVFHCVLIKDMIKTVSESPYREFRDALNYLLEKEWRGRQKILASKSGISNPFLSQLKKGERVCSAGTCFKIAKEMGRTYEEMLALGRALENKSDGKLSVNEKTDIYGNETEKNDNVLKLIKEHKNIIEDFKDKKAAYEINKKLLEIEKTSPETFEIIRKMIDIHYEAVKPKKNTVNG